LNALQQQLANLGARIEQIRAQDQQFQQLEGMRTRLEARPERLEKGGSGTGRRSLSRCVTRSRAAKQRSKLGLQAKALRSGAMDRRIAPIVQPGSIQPGMMPRPLSVGNTG